MAASRGSKIIVVGETISNLAERDGVVTRRSRAAKWNASKALKNTALASNEPQGKYYRRLGRQEHLLPPSLIFDHSDGTGYVCISSSTQRIMHSIFHAAIHHGKYLSYGLMMISEPTRPL